MRSPVALFGAIVAAALLLTVSPRTVGQGPTVSSVVSDLLSQGDGYTAHRNYVKALESYQKAEKASHHECSVCWLREVKIYKTAGDFNTALDCAKKAEKEAGGNKREMSEALLTHANLLAAISSKPKDRKLVEAVADTRQALALDPDETIAHFNLGVLLMKQEQDADGAAELKAYLASNTPDAATAKSAREDLADPRRAREPYAPEFAFTTLENEQVSLASLHGKVALLDFWGSWCPPCRASIPTIAGLQKDFAKKQVEFIGISSDNDAEAWQRFVAANRMVWPEYLDLDGHVQQAFAVDSYPTYIVLDRNGVIRFRQSGFDEQSSGGELSEALDKALKVKLETTSPTAIPPAGDSGAEAAPVARSSSAPDTLVEPSRTADVPSAYGNAEPTYVHVRSGQDARPADASLSSAHLFGTSIQVLEPAHGFDFSQYLASVMSVVKSHWLSLIPQTAQSGKRALASVTVSIDRGGKVVTKPVIQLSSGDVSLDNAALAAIADSSPFSPLPEGFSGGAIKLRVVFLYNGTSQDFQTGSAESQ